MARKKIKLAWIANDSARRATFKKRKKGLMKKVSELSTLCGVGACAVIFSPFESEPEVWPPLLEAHRVIGRFRSLPEMEQSKKMMNQEAFLRQSINKTMEQLKKHQKENREMEMEHLMHQSLTGQKGYLHGVSIVDLGNLAWLVEERIKAIGQRIEMLKTMDKTCSRRNNNGGEELLKTMDKSCRRNNNGGEINGEKASLESAMEALQKQPWFMEVMNPNDHQNLGVTGDVPFGNNTSSSSWSNGFNNV